MLESVNGQTKFQQTLQEQRQESDEEHEEDTDDAAHDPLKHGNQVVASRLSTDGLSLVVVLTNEQLLVQSTEEQHYESSRTGSQRRIKQTKSKEKMREEMRHSQQSMKT